MRMLVLTDMFPPIATGGYERSCADVVQRWREAGHEVTVLTTEASRSDGPGVLWCLPARHAADERGRRTVEAAIEEVRPDVVSAWNLARLPVGSVLNPVAAAGIPLVLVVCDGWLDDAPPDVARPAPGSAVVYVSDHLCRTSNPPSWAPATRTVVPGGIDTRIFRPHFSPRRRWRGRLLYVGRLAEAKGVDDAIAALVDLPTDTTLRIVGPGSRQRRRDLLAHAMALGVERRIWMSRAERHRLVREYQDADALLFPSRWDEPFGLVGLEAMACSTPVIATGTGGSATYLEHERNALLVPPHDPRAMALAAGRLAGDAALRTRLVAAGVRTSRRYTVDLLAARLGELHRRAAAGADR